MPISLTDPQFWPHIGGLLGTAQRDNTFGLDYVVLDHIVGMHFILRTGEELFSSTVDREGRRFKVVVNGNYYDVSRAGLLDAALGHDPVAATETTILGRVVDNGAVIGGQSSPSMFYFAQYFLPSTDSRYLWTYITGFGDPPLGGGTAAAIGGLGPLIIGGLRYGTQNRYRPGAPPSAPASGPPGTAATPFLVERSNNTFRSAESRPEPTGKTIMASSSTRRKLLVGVQAHGAAPGSRYATLRDTLGNLDFDHAVFLDGSDSAMMMVNGTWVVQAGEDKDETNIIGVGFV